MKLTTLLLFIALLQVSAKTFSQVTLHEKNAPFSQVLNSIERQSGYTFVYNEDKVKLGSLSIDLTNASIEQTLRECFKNLPVVYKIVDKNIVLQPADLYLPKKAKSVSGIYITVSGHVLDSIGNPLQGATLLLDSNHIVALTDQFGKFSFSAQIGDRVTVSYIGYKQYYFSKYCSSYDVRQTKRSYC